MEPRHPFYWRFANRNREVPPDVEEQAAALWEKRYLDRAEAAFRLLIECFPGYADGERLRPGKAGLAQTGPDVTARPRRAGLDTPLPRRRSASPARSA